MTVHASTPITSYTGNGVTTIFAFGFKILQASDLRVLVAGAVVTNYTVSGVGSPSGGSITFTAAPANGATIIIRRAMAYARGTDFQTLGSLSANTLNDDQDAPVMMSAQLAEALNRTILAPESDIALTQLPSAAARANLLLSFDSNGQPTVAAPVAGSASALATQLASSAGSAGVGFLQSGTGAVARTVQSKLREAISVFDFGAVGDGVADDTVAIQNALNAGRSVLIPPTANFYKITAPLNVPSGCNLFMSGANITSTVAGIFRFPSGGVAAIHAARSVLQTNTTSAGAAIAIASGATTVTEAYIYGFPLIIAANSIVNGAFRGIDMRGFYRSYLEVKVYGFYYGIFADGDNGGTFATYYNVLMKPDIYCGSQGYGIYLTNLCNATTIVSPFINGGNIGYGGIAFEDTDGCNVLGGYVEGFAANVSTFGLNLINSNGITVTGLTLDQTSGDITANYAIRISGNSDGNSIINAAFAGSWNDSSRMLLNTSSGKNSFIGNGYTNAFVFGLNGVGLANEGTFVNKLTAYDNVVIGTAGKGVDFTSGSNAAGMTSELLNDYEEGNWTPNQGSGLTVTGAFSSSGRYTKVGRQVTVTAQLNGATSISATSGGILSSNLPFTAGTDGSGTRHDVNFGNGGVVYVSGTSAYSVGAITSTTRVYFSATYFV